MSGTRKTLITLFVMFVIVWGTLFSLTKFVWDRTEIPEIARDLIILAVAHNKAGDPIPFTVDYNPEDTFDYRGVRTNSVFLVDTLYRLLPYYSYERAVTNTKMPGSMLFEYVPGDGSFHLLGWAYLNTPNMCINERVLSEPSWNDIRLYYEVVLHECLHLQRYLFSGGTTQEVEAHTVSGTLEVTAGASIRSQDDNLTRSFWYQIEGFARDSLRARLHKHDLDKVYKWIMDVFFRDRDIEMRADKSARYWATRTQGLWQIIIDYGQYPWDTYILPGVIGKPMPVREYRTEDEYHGCVYYSYSMQMDDTHAMLGEVLTWIISITTEVKDE